MPRINQDRIDQPAILDSSLRHWVLQAIDGYAQKLSSGFPCYTGADEFREYSWRDVIIGAAEKFGCIVLWVPNEKRRKKDPEEKMILMKIPSAKVIMEGEGTKHIDPNAAPELKAYKFPSNVTFEIKEGKTNKRTGRWWIEGELDIKPAKDLEENKLRRK